MAWALTFLGFINPLTAAVAYGMWKGWNAPIIPDNMGVIENGEVIIFLE